MHDIQPTPRDMKDAHRSWRVKEEKILGPCLRKSAWEKKKKKKLLSQQQPKARVAGVRREAMAEDDRWGPAPQS